MYTGVSSGRTSDPMGYPGRKRTLEQRQAGRCSVLMAGEMAGQHRSSQNWRRQEMKIQWSLVSLESPALILTEDFQDCKVRNRLPF